jgi:invasion protein IalB
VRTSPMKRWFGIMLVLAGCLASGAGRAGDSPLLSPMIDRTLFRDGEVKSTRQQYGDWSLTCDEVVRLRRRFCSLRTIVSHDARTVLVLDVSTGDDGRAAGLLHVPVGVSLTAGVALGPQKAQSKGHRRSAQTRTLPIEMCSRSECNAVVTFQPNELSELDSGRGLEVRYTPVDDTRLTDFSRSLSAGSLKGFAISGRGFHDAVEASLH